MWYDEDRATPVKAPSQKEKWTLRILLVIGFGSMFFFLWEIAQPMHKGYAPLYYLLMFSLVFLCFKIAYEWYHYFSISVPEKKPPKKQYTVDILTTYFPGEPYKMVLETLEAIQNISYPHTTYLCDEANDPYLAEQCKKLGVKHVTRTNRINAKAGNINNALKQATGEICLIFDPDHIPAPEFLDQVLPHFNDDRVGFVQPVQGYYNISENIIAKASAQQTFQFYGPIMMSMNSYGTAQAIGANCCFRRKALDSIGGHAPGLAEDMNTSMKLHARGWKSVYVPRVLNRGLVPSTISAYYKQQLKWSRGVFELLLTTYIENFKNFSWRQKLHYGLLPWHYFSGAIYLINFLIPVLALLLGAMPMQINIAYFFLVGMPFFASIILIRHYVQRWVMEEDERGLHLVGGILLIGAWWIHLLGFIFTLLRRKVPYNPTPKDGQEENILALNLPNIFIAGLSIFAVAYGLHYDFNPYSLAMAGFALLNVGFMVLMLLISYQNRYREYKKTHPFADKLAVSIWQVKRLFWIFRHRMYGFIRVLALPLIVVLVGGLFYYASSTDITDIEAPQTPDLATAKYLGAYLPSDGPAGMTGLQKYDSLNAVMNGELGIVSSYLAWQPLQEHPFPKAYLEQIYQRGAYPMLTWEPWLSGFSGYGGDSIPHMQQIQSGRYDEYLEQMAQHFKELNRPLFLRFAHEPENPQYPWYRKGEAAAADYILAWRYVHRFMSQRGVKNLIWVYNPWKAKNATRYYPGDAYVDWLGVTALNYAGALHAENWQTFDDLYAPFHRSVAFKRNLPVMLAEFGTLKGARQTATWYRQALQSIEHNYPEIKAVVLFGAPADKNLPPGSPGPHLNWLSTAGPFGSFGPFRENYSPPRPIPPDEKPSQAAAENDVAYAEIQGVNYVKSSDWQASMHPLFKREVLGDFSAVKNLGLNWVKRYGPGVYDRNVLHGAREQELNVVYALWIDKHLNYLQDHQKLAALRDKILKTVARQRDYDEIKAWHLGNPVWHSLGSNFSKPGLFYQREAYLNWLKKLVREIKKTDPTRPVSIELEQDPYVELIAKELKTKVPELDAVGLVLHQGPVDFHFLQKLENLPLPAFISRMSPQEPEVYDQLEQGWFLDSWQDDVFAHSVSFTGLLDHEGRPKPGFRSLQLWTGVSAEVDLPEARILPAAVIPYPGREIEFNALLEKEDQWEMAAFDGRELHFDWYLLKTDEYGNALAMEKVGEGPRIFIESPPNPFEYKVYLLASRDGYATSHISKLATPVYFGPGLEEFSSEQIRYMVEAQP